MKNFRNVILMLVVFAMSSLLFSAIAQTTITCQHDGDWDDETTWDLGRMPHSGDDVHIEGKTVTRSGNAPVNIDDIHLDNHATLILLFSTPLTVSGEIHLDNNSDLEVYCPTVCKDVDMDNRSNICLHASFTFCFININNRSNFWCNGNEVTITNCINISNPVYVHNQSSFGLDKDCNGSNITSANLNIKGNVSLNDCNIIYNNITITNGTLNLGSCNVTINGVLTLNAGGDLITTGTLTYGPNAKLAFNRSYTLNSTSKIWGTGLTATNIPNTVEILSGVVSINDTLTVKRRINLLGGTIGNGSVTKLKLAANDTVFKCGGNFASTPFFGTNVTMLYCAPQPGNPPAVFRYRNTTGRIYRKCDYIN